MVHFYAVCGCCTRTDIVREHLEDTLRICDVSAMGLYNSQSQLNDIRLRHVACLYLPAGVLAETSEIL
jgi:hypothetical protein